MTSSTADAISFFGNDVRSSNNGSWCEPLASRRRRILAARQRMAPQPAR